jgi:hypothetical protein
MLKGYHTNNANHTKPGRLKATQTFGSSSKIPTLNPVALIWLIYFPTCTRGTFLTNS